MVKKLEKAVYKRFGLVYGDSGLQAARGRLLSQCLARYERERWQNHLDPEAAFAAALPTPEEVEAARAPYVREGMARAYYCGLCLLLALAGIPLLYAAVACVRRYMASGSALFSLLVFVSAAVSVWMIVQGFLWLKRSVRKTVAWIMLVIGVPLLAIKLLLIFAFVDTGRFYRYDYTDRVDAVASIELVRLDETPQRSSEEECLKYTVLEAAAPEQYGALLKDLANLRYWFRWFGDPPGLWTGTEIILIRFSPEQDGMLYAFYGRWHPGYVQREGTTQETEYYLCPCSDEQWDELAAKYFPDAPLE